MATITSVNISPQTALIEQSVIIQVSITWPAITHEVLTNQTHNSLAVNKHDDFKGGVA